MSEPVAKRLRSEDAERFLALRAEALAAEPQVFRVKPEDDAVIGLEGWAQQLERDYVVGIDVDGVLVAMGGLSRFFGHKLKHKALVWGMYVRPQARGTGISDMLMNALLQFAPQRVRQLQITVIASNLRAIAFYERHGFRIYATEPGAVRMGTRYVDEALMWRQVGQGVVVPDA
jgi:ribosomal protein S18 acetylase RimI-like enzyme